MPPPYPWVRNVHPVPGKLTFSMTSNAAEVAAAQEEFGRRGAIAMRRVTTQATLDLKKRLKEAAPIGPPKRPDYQEGDYKKSIKHNLTNAGGVREGTVYTDSPYAFRLEHRFDGLSDSLGRDYELWGAIPPNKTPHWQPEVTRMEQELPLRYEAMHRYIAGAYARQGAKFAIPPALHRP